MVTKQDIYELSRTDPAKEPSKLPLPEGFVIGEHRFIKIMRVGMNDAIYVTDKGVISTANEFAIDKINDKRIVSSFVIGFIIYYETEDGLMYF